MFNTTSQSQSNSKLLLYTAEKSDQIEHCNSTSFFTLEYKNPKIHPPSEIPALHYAEYKACILSLTPCISNYTAAPSRPVLTEPTCYTAECLASKWDGQEISHWSHLDTLLGSTGGNNHPNTVKYKNIMHVSFFTQISNTGSHSFPLREALFESSSWDLTLVCF